MERSAIRESGLLTQPRISLRFIRATTSRASSPRVSSGPRVRRSFLLLISSEEACGTAGRFAAPAAPCVLAHGATCLFQGTWLRVPLESTRQGCFGQPPRKQENACVPHATVLSACNSQRGHVLGLLTECLARHIAGSLGRPPRVRVIVLSLVCTERGTWATPPHERPAHATGPSHPAPRRR
jgi:hypothetical protein